jgi:hypothetical protein
LDRLLGNTTVSNVDVGLLAVAGMAGAGLIALSLASLFYIPQQEEEMSENHSYLTAQVVEHHSQHSPPTPQNEIDAQLLTMIGSLEQAGLIPQASPPGVIESMLGQWRMTHQIKYLERQIQRDELWAQSLEAKAKVIAQLWASGLVSPQMRVYLETTYSGFLKRAQQEEELADLKHEHECEKERAEIAKLRSSRPESLEDKYRRLYERTTKRILADLRGGFEMRRAVIEEVMKIKKEIDGDPSLTESERQEMFEMLKQDVYQAFARIKQEQPRE